MNNSHTILIVFGLVVSHVAAIYAGGAYVRRQLKKDPAKLEKMIADAKALRDKVQKKFE